MPAEIRFTSYDTIRITQSDTWEKGDFINISGIDTVGFAFDDAKVKADGNYEGNVVIACAIVQLPKDSNAASSGANAYWDTGNERVTATAGSNILIGAFRDNYLAGDSTADVCFNGREHFLKA